MSRLKTRGVVLSRTLSGEADYICSIYSKDLGRERFVFKGIRKSQKRPRSATEPGTILDLVYYTGNSGTLNTVSEFDIVSSCLKIRKSSESIFSLYYMVELVDSTTGFGDINDRIYNLLCAGLDMLGRTETPLHFIIFFTARYMALQGILPELSSCSWCGGEVDRDLLIDPVSLRVSCRQCSAGGRAITSEGAVYLRETLDNKFTHIDTAIYRAESLLPLHRSLTAYIENYYGIKIRSAEMLGRT